MANLIGQLARSPEVYETVDSICCEMRLLVDDGPHDPHFETVVIFAEPGELPQLPEIGDDVEVLQPHSIKYGGRWVKLAEYRPERVL